MNENMIKVLKPCVERTRNGESTLNIFDLMYETGLPYPELKTALDELIADNKIEYVDLKTYKFIGDVNCDIKGPKEEVQPVGEDNYVEERRLTPQERREELLRRMRSEFNRDSDSDDEDEDDESFDKLIGALGLFDDDENDSDDEDE